jgi:hypothetical protein
MDTLYDEPHKMSSFVKHLTRGLRHRFRGYKLWVSWQVYYSWNPLTRQLLPKELPIEVNDEEKAFRDPGWSLGVPCTARSSTHPETGLWHAIIEAKADAVNISTVLVTNRETWLTWCQPGLAVVSQTLPSDQGRRAKEHWLYSKICRGKIRQVVGSVALRREIKHYVFSLRFPDLRTVPPSDPYIKDFFEAHFKFGLSTKLTHTSRNTKDLILLAGEGLHGIVIGNQCGTVRRPLVIIQDYTYENDHTSQKTGHGRQDDHQVASS